MLTKVEEEAEEEDEHKRTSNTLVKFSEWSKDVEMNPTIISCRAVHRTGKRIIGAILHLS